MTENKYGKYFITETPPNPRHPQNRAKGSNVPWDNSLYISEELNGTVKGAFYLETNMVMRTGTIDLVSTSHSHPFDEYLIFLGTNPDDLFDLGGEVEFWVGDEKHMITKTCAVFVPGGVPHCPLFIHRVDRPFMFVTTGPTLGYGYDGDNENRTRASASK